MVELYCRDGIVYTDVYMSYEALEHIMTNDIVRENDFVSFQFSDGSRGAVRKKNINGFFEIKESK